MALCCISANNFLIGNISWQLSMDSIYEVKMTFLQEIRCR